MKKKLALVLAAALMLAVLAGCGGTRPQHPGRLQPRFHGRRARGAGQ